MEERCNCCGKKFEEKTNWHFTIPEVGYGSLFDRVDPDKPVSMTICPTCFEQMNRWLKKKYPQLNLQEFWRFEIIDKSAEYNAPQGYIREIKHEKELYDMVVKFVPDVYFDKDSNPIKKFFIKAWNLIRRA